MNTLSRYITRNIKEFRNVEELKNYFKQNIETVDYAILLTLNDMYYPFFDINKPFEEEIEKVYKLKR